MIEQQQPTMPTEQPIVELTDAMSCLLSDMGVGGFCVSGYVKARARLAYEPSMEIMEDDAEGYMDITEAQRIVAECDCDSRS